ncbi:MAG: hypothetical protein Q4C50_08920 [Eubacteriales bacterium]|nr:hypothetical protein [Eubacteriales bacterium]
MKTKKQRVPVLIMCLIFAAAVFLSMLFIVKEADHDCAGENCPVCACIHQAERTLKQLGTGKVESVPLMEKLPSVIMAIFLAVLMLPCVSLISRKVRLND